ncbi:MAG: glycosyltransferase family 39 protein [Rhodospirillales bacterium]|nr:glycosyltransferase family 39 protein [Rhodospirillales bacterium]
MTEQQRPLALVSGLWLVVMAAVLFTRPPLPVDETRYLAVAWDMWLEGHYLVPHLNGEPYSHKPPLLFWLINFGWWAFGVNEWWPRLIAPAAGLASLFLTARLAAALWPGAGAARRFAPPLLFGGLYWALFTTLTMFDMLLALFTLLALLGLVRAARQGGFGGFALAGLAIGLGVLAKGPAILVHVLPAAVAAPWWAGRLDGLTTPVRFGGRWAIGVAAAVAIGAVIGLAWAVPAASAGGAEYRDAILWGQSAGRMVDSFAHAEPWWLYVVVLPALLLPWTVWPPAWRAVRRLGQHRSDGGVRLCAVWFVAAMLIFSAISGKQFHYLLPELPALALLLARMLAAEADAPLRPGDAIPPALLVALAGAAVVALPVAVSTVTAIKAEAPWLDHLAAGWGVALIAAGAAIVAARRLALAARLSMLAATAAVAVVAAHLALKPVLAAFYDLRPLAGRLAEWEAQGIALANFGKYHGQYHFLGRLKKPIAVVGVAASDERDFLAAHPTGRIVAYHDTLPERGGAKPVAVFRFRSRVIAVWDVATVIANPGIARR